METGKNQLELFRALDVREVEERTQHTSLGSSSSSYNIKTD
jgi:hypothetical protein